MSPVVRATSNQTAAMTDSATTQAGELSGSASGAPTTVAGPITPADGPLFDLMKNTGYPIVQENGQRRYGPPPGWDLDVNGPPRGCEVFVGKIPRDCFEDELVPVLEKVGKIYEVYYYLLLQDIYRVLKYVKNIRQCWEYLFTTCQNSQSHIGIKWLNEFDEYINILIAVIILFNNQLIILK